jgi:DNA repair/transcription protein MET18/MMS19
MGCTALLRATAATGAAADWLGGVELASAGQSEAAAARTTPAVSHAAATEMADRFFETVHVPSLVQV